MATAVKGTDLLVCTHLIWCSCGAFSNTEGDTSHSTMQREGEGGREREGGGEREREREIERERERDSKG